MSQIDDPRDSTEPEASDPLAEGRLEALAEAMGGDPRRLQVLSEQTVRLEYTETDARFFKVVDTATGRELASLTPPSGFVQRLAFSPDGRLAAVVGDDSTGVLWEVPSLVRAARPQPVTLTGPQRKTEWAALLADDAVAAYRSGTVLAAAPQQA